MKRKQKLRVIALVTAMVMLMTGCGNRNAGSDSPSNNNGTENAESNTESEGAENTGKTGNSEETGSMYLSDEKLDITIWFPKIGRAHV